MDLKLEDVAALLNISQSTVSRWVVENKIPHYRLNQEFRFSHSEIEDWVLSQPLEWQSDVTESGGLHQFSLYRALHKGGIYTQISGTTKEEVLLAAVRHIAADLRLDAEMITDFLLERERLMSTALSHGLAVPHTREFLLKGGFDVVSVVFLDQPIPYGALDGQPVDTLFFLFACDNKRHLNLLAKLAHLSQNRQLLALLRQHPTKPQLLEHVRQWEGHLKGVPS